MDIYSFGIIALLRHYLIYTGTSFTVLSQRFILLTCKFIQLVWDFETLLPYISRADSLSYCNWFCDAQKNANGITKLLSIEIKYKSFRKKHRIPWNGLIKD